MKQKLFVMLMLLVSTSTVLADPVGTWEISMDGPGGTMVNYLTIRKEGNAHYASMANPQGEAEIGEIQVTGDHIEFTFSREMGTRVMNMSYKCDVEGDVLTGTATTPRGTLPFTGIRQ
jgi:hypothetical protein